VSEIANRYCSTFRDIYLRRVLGRSAPYTYKTIRGWIYHAVSSRAVREVKSIVYRRWPCTGSKLLILLQERRREVLDSIFAEHEVARHLNGVEESLLRRDSEAIYDYICLQAASRLDKILSEVTGIPELESVVARAIPVEVEKLIDGRLLGLSRELKVDMFTDRRIVADIKTGDVREFHKYALAGYALAIESDLEIPIDFGVITYLSVEDGVVKVRNVIQFIGDELRREFIDMRDEAFRVVHSGMDPGRPPECPEYCVYYTVCGGELLCR